MRIESITQPSFKCHKESIERIREYGKIIRDTGFFNGKKLDIYSAYSKDGQIIHKLYYLSDSVGNWIKSKLKYYKGRQIVKIIRSERDDSNVQE